MEKQVKCQICSKIFIKKGNNNNKYCSKECYNQFIKKYMKIYRLTHKKEILEQRKKWQKTHKEQNEKYYQEHKVERNKYHKKYREEHKEEKQLYQKNNKKEIKEYMKKYSQKHKEERLNYILQYRYGITIKQYNQILRNQKGVCAICGNLPLNKGLGIDHNHITKKIRGLLCGKCNRGLGNFNDNKDLLLKAIKYLKIK